MLSKECRDSIQCEDGKTVENCYKNLISKLSEESKTNACSQNMSDKGKQEFEEFERFQKLLNASFDKLTMDQKNKRCGEHRTKKSPLLIR